MSKHLNGKQLKIPLNYSYKIITLVQKLIQVIQVSGWTLIISQGFMSHSTLNRSL